MRIGFLGFGEAGEAMARSMLEMPDVSACAYDKLFDDKAMLARKAAAYEGQIDITCLASPKALAEASDIVISVVTADEAYAAAQSILPYLRDTHLYLDGNSVSPGTKKAIAETFMHLSRSYVDLAIMAPIHPRGHKTPFLVSGPRQVDVCTLLDTLHANYEWRGAAIGEASTVKMLRSILIKGMESLICECVTAAEGLGLDTEILASAGKTLGINDMPALADYVMERASVHGRRRAAEMREVAKTLDELGLSNFMPTAIAKHQSIVADMNLVETFNGDVPRNRAQLAQAMRSAQSID